MKNKIIFALIIGAILLNLLSFKIGQDWGDDFGGYIKQAQTLSNGSFQDLREHIAKSDPILNYPWGYPILLSPFIHYFDTDLNVLKYYTYAFFVLSFLFIFLLLKKEREFALLTILLLSCNPYFWEFKNYLIANFPNLCFVYLSLYLINRVIIKKQLIGNEYISNFLVGLSIFICYIMRNQSIVLLPTLLVLQAVIYKKSLLKIDSLKKVLIPYLTFFILAYILSILIPIKTTSYTAQYNFNFLFILKTIWNNIFYYLKIWEGLFEAIGGVAYFPVIFSTIAVGFTIIGVSISRKKDDLLLLVFPFLSILLLLITPFYQGLRYVIPIIPLFLFFCIKGCYYLFTSLHKKYGKYAYSFLMVLLIAGSFRTILAYSYFNYKRPKIMQGPYEKDGVEMFAYIKDSTTKDDIIECWKPRVILLFTGRDCIFTANIESYFSRKPDYVIYCKQPPTGDDLQIPLDTLYKYPSKLSPVFENHNFVIFKTKKIN